MAKYDYGKLQNGSDIRGVAIKSVAGEAVNLDAEAAGRIARGFLYTLCCKSGKNPRELSVAIGRDPRLSGKYLAEAFCNALLSYGTTVMDAGLSSTPAMFMSTVFPEYSCDGAVMITASHLPFNRNGMKFFDRNGGFDKGDITDIIAFAQSDSILNSMTPGQPRAIEEIPLLDTYCAYLRKLITEGIGCEETAKPLSSMKIVVDAGNGSGGFFASQVLSPLGADISGSQFLEPDGNFPNHAPNPEDPSAMASICAKVIETGADLGLIFDTDVDRSSAVDETGCEINRNSIAAMAAALISDKYPGTTVVTDSVTSSQLTDFIENSLGLKHLRFKRGYKNVINKAIELNSSGIDAELAVETSGHAAYRENYFLDDGAYLATKIVVRAAQLHREGKPVSSVLSSLKSPLESVEIRLPISGENFAGYGESILEHLSLLFGSGQIMGASISYPNYEGVRIDFNTPSVKGWFLLRKSLHDPIMPLNIESETQGGVSEIRKILKPLLTSYDMLDVSAL